MLPVPHLDGSTWARPISGTSSPSQVINGFDYLHFMIADNPANPKIVGCNGLTSEVAQVANAAGDDSDPNVPPSPPCFDHRSMALLLDGHITWKYYTQTNGSNWATSIRTAPNSLVDICGHGLTGQPCAGDDWNNKVEPRRAQILRACLGEIQFSPLTSVLHEPTSAGGAK